MGKAIVGIDPKTKRCEVVATDEPDNWAECRDMGLIVVPTTIENARASWGEVIADVYALAVPNDRVEGRDAALSRRVPSHDGLCGTVDSENKT